MTRPSSFSQEAESSRPGRAPVRDIRVEDVGGPDDDRAGGGERERGHGGGVCVNEPPGRRGSFRPARVRRMERDRPSARALDNSVLPTPRDPRRGIGAGFAKSNDADSNDDRMKSKTQEELKRHFRPEFLNRVDDIVVFRQLTPAETIKIAARLKARRPVRGRGDAGARPAPEAHVTRRRPCDRAGRCWWCGALDVAGKPVLCAAALIVCLRGAFWRISRCAAVPSGRRGRRLSPIRGRRGRSAACGRTPGSR